MKIYTLILIISPLLCFSKILEFDFFKKKDSFWEKTIKQARRDLKIKKSPKIKQEAYFRLAYTYYNLKNYSLSKSYFEKIHLKELLNHSYYFLAQNAFKLRDFMSFKKYFKKINRKKIHYSKWNDLLFSEAIFYKEKNQTSMAYQKFKKLERRVKEKYPIWEHLANISMRMKKPKCLWVYKMYQNPKRPFLIQYNKNNLSYKERMSCPVFHQRILRKRVRRLFFTGNSKRAFKEIKKIHQFSPFNADLLKAELYLLKAEPHKALGVLSKHPYEEQKSYLYFMYHAKASQYSGYFHQALLSYLKSYKLAPKFSQKRKSYFLIAYFYFQQKKYSKAISYFKSFIEKFPNKSSYKTSAYWNLGFSYYLNKNYKEADKYFKKLLNKKQAISSAVSEEKIKYWMAVNYLKMNKKEKAFKIFNELADNHLTHYYSLMSYLRLQDNHQKAHFESFKTNDLLKAEKELQKPIKDPAFYLADLMLKYGFKDLASLELRNLQYKNNKNRKFLYNLMKKYYQNQFYYRALSVEEIYFSHKRKKEGLKETSELWLISFPQAFKELILKESFKKNIPPELVWSLIKGESLFKVDAQSSVNAKGLMQIMNYTAKFVLKNEKPRKNYSIKSIEKNIFIPKTNILLGVSYLKYLSERFEGNIPYIFAAYNAGPHRVDLWAKNKKNYSVDEFVELISFPETRNYLKKLYRYFVTYSMMKNEKAIYRASYLNWMKKMRNLSSIIE